MAHQESADYRSLEGMRDGYRSVGNVVPAQQQMQGLLHDPSSNLQGERRETRRANSVAVGTWQVTFIAGVE